MNNNKCKIIFASIIVFFYISICIFTIFNNEGFIENDSYFHYRYSSSLLEDKDNSINLKYSMHYNRFIDNEYLFHCIVSCFAKYGLIGAKIYIILSLLLSLFVFTILSKSINKNDCSLGILLFFVASIDFCVRMMMLRVGALSLILILLYTYSLLKNNYYMNFFISIVFALTYSAFVLCICILINYFLAYKFKFSILLSTFLGFLIGILLHPNFPEIVCYTILSIYQRVFFLPSMDMGLEWLSYNFKDFLIYNYIVAIIFAFVIYICLSKKQMKVDEKTKFFFLNFIFFFLLLVKSGRFIEYFHFWFYF